MEFMEGIELLYSNHYNNIACKVVTVILALLAITILVLCTIHAIRDREYLDILLAIGTAAAIGIFAFICFGYSSEFDIYTVRIDNTVSFVELVNEYGSENITNVGGDVYEIKVVNYDEHKWWK